jgi:hypothetical protein
VNVINETALPAGLAVEVAHLLSAWPVSNASQNADCAAFQYRCLFW